MASVILKNKRNHRINDRDFIVVDDITGIKKMRSECKIDGYGFLSAHGDPRHPQETPPIICEDMAAWPDPRPITPPDYIDYSYVHFIFSAVFIEFIPVDGFTFDASGSVGLDAPIVNYEWAVEGDYVATGVQSTLTLTGGPNEITLRLTDTAGNVGTYTFTYTVLYAIGLESGGLIGLESGGIILTENN